MFQQLKYNYASNVLKKRVLNLEIVQNGVQAEQEVSKQKCFKAVFTLCNFSCNLFRNFVALQVARRIVWCNTLRNHRVWNIFVVASVARSRIKGDNRFLKVGRTEPTKWCGGIPSKSFFLKSNVYEMPFPAFWDYFFGTTFIPCFSIETKPCISAKQQ